MKWQYFLFMFLAGCSSQMSQQTRDDQTIVRELPASKQRQRIAFLQKKLIAAQREKQKAECEVDRLKNEVRSAQLALIRKHIDDYEFQIGKLQSDPLKYNLFMQREMSSLFIKEREELHELIQSDPSSGAQALLDRILRLITELSDDTKITGRI